MSSRRSTTCAGAAGRGALLALAVALTGCTTVFRSEDPATCVGPRIGLGVYAGWQEMGAGVDENDNEVYSEGGMPWSNVPLIFSWGMQSGKVYLEPFVWLGSASGTVDNGKRFGIFDAQFEQYGGPSTGYGLKTRFGLADTRMRFGLDLLYFRFAGESDFTVDAPPSTKPHDVQAVNVQVGIVLEYDDPSYRPYLSLGILLNHTKFEDQSSPGSTVTVQSREVFGASLGVAFKQLFGSRLGCDVALGYYAGPLFSLGVGYRF